MTRLESLFPEIVSMLHTASADKQRKAGVVACEFAIAHARIENPIVDRALEALRKVGVLTFDDKSKLDALAAQLDEEYFVLQESAQGDRISIDKSMQRFSQARAIAALSFAGDENAFEAAAEAIYEAAAATENQSELATLVQQVLE